MQPHAARGADVGERRDRVDRAGQRGAGGRDHGDRCDARRRGRRRSPSATASGAQPAVRRRSATARTPSAPMPEHLGRALDRVVGLGRAVDRRRAVPPRPSRRTPGSGPLARGRECGQVRDRAAARERAAAGRVARPARRPIAPPAPRSRVAAPAYTARLGSKHDASASPITPISSPEEPTNAKYRGARLSDALVQDPRGVLQNAGGRRGVGGQRCQKQRAHGGIDLRLLGAGVVESPPRFRDQPHGVGEHLLARRIERRDG